MAIPKYDKLMKHALELGMFMLRRAERLNTCVSVSVRSAEGAVLFPHLPEGTSKNNENWMRRIPARSYLRDQ